VIHRELALEVPFPGEVAFDGLALLGIMIDVVDDDFGD